MCRRPNHTCQWRICAWIGSYRSGGAHSEGKDGVISLIRVIIGKIIGKI